MLLKREDYADINIIKLISLEWMQEIEHQK